MKTENVANIGFKSTKSEKPFLSQAEKYIHKTKWKKHRILNLEVGSYNSSGDFICLSHILFVCLFSIYFCEIYGEKNKGDNMRT